MNMVANSLKSGVAGPPTIDGVQRWAVRTAGFSLAYSLATAVFGGFTPAINTYLIHVTGNRAVPGLWLSFAAMCGLAASLLAKPQPTTVETI